MQERTPKTRKILRYAAIGILILAMVYQWHIRGAFDAYNWYGQYDKLGYYLPYRASSFYITAAILLLIRQRLKMNACLKDPALGAVSRADRQMWTVKLLVWSVFAAVWIWYHFRNMRSFFSENPWDTASGAAWRNVAPTLVLLYTVDFLRKSGSALRLEWTEDQPLWAKLLLSLKTLLFDGIARMGTMTGKLFYAIQFGFACHVVISLLKMYPLSAPYYVFFDELVDTPITYFWYVAGSALVYLLFIEKDD